MIGSHAIGSLRDIEILRVGIVDGKAATGEYSASNCKELGARDQGSFNKTASVARRAVRREIEK